MGCNLRDARMTAYGPVGAPVRRPSSADQKGGGCDSLAAGPFAGAAAKPRSTDGSIASNRSLPACDPSVIRGVGEHCASLDRACYTPEQFTPYEGAEAQTVRELRSRPAWSSSAGEGKTGRKNRDSPCRLHIGTVPVFRSFSSANRGALLLWLLSSWAIKKKVTGTRGRPPALHDAVVLEAPITPALRATPPTTSPALPPPRHLRCHPSSGRRGGGRRGVTCAAKAAAAVSARRRAA
jgi:hypothetical protein